MRSLLKRQILLTKTFGFSQIRLFTAKDRNPSLTTDVKITDAIVTKKIEGKEHILLITFRRDIPYHFSQNITRGNDPFKGHYAFPGGFVDYGEDPEVGVLRELQEECGIDGASDTKLITVAGKPDRDTRGHTVSIFYHV